MKEVLNELIEDKVLSATEAHAVLLELATGKVNQSQMAAFLTVYMMRGIAVEELRGFRQAMMDLCLTVSFERSVIDVCGTGGDGKNTINISTLAAFVVAGTGQGVAKHGNYGVSSACGSSNVLEFLGYRFTSDLDHLHRCLDKANLCFMHAPLFHPAMKNVGSVRKELGIKTFFNMLGPLVNPADPHFQFVGVFSLELARQYAYLLQSSTKKFLVVHSLDGYDEVSLTGPFKFYSNNEEQIVEPSELKLPTVKPDEISGGKTVSESAQLFLDILQRKGSSSQNNVVIANAALALYAINPEAGMQDTLLKANESLLSGNAYQCFQKLMNIK